MRGRVPEIWMRGCRLGSTEQRSSGCFCRLGRRRRDTKNLVFEETSCRTRGPTELGRPVLLFESSSAQSTSAECLL